MYKGARKQIAVCQCTTEHLTGRLDVALGSLIYWPATLPVAGGLKLGDLYGPFQPSPFYDSMIQNTNTNNPCSKAFQGYDCGKWH